MGGAGSGGVGRLGWELTWNVYVERCGVVDLPRLRPVILPTSSFEKLPHLLTETKVYEAPHTTALPPPNAVTSRVASDTYQPEQPPG